MIATPVRLDSVKTAYGAVTRMLHGSTYRNGCTSLRRSTRLHREKSTSDRNDLGNTHLRFAPNGQHVALSWLNRNSSDLAVVKEDRQKERGILDTLQGVNLAAGEINPFSGTQ